jgi:hypothetical protein
MEISKLDHERYRRAVRSVNAGAYGFYVFFIRRQLLFPPFLGRVQQNLVMDRAHRWQSSYLPDIAVSSIPTHVELGAERSSLWHRFWGWMMEPYFVGEWVYWTGPLDPRLAERSKQRATGEITRCPWPEDDRRM